MVILKVSTTFMTGLENTVVINSAVEELKPFSQVIITKANGTRHQFKLIMTSTVPRNYVLIGESEIRMHRLQLNHKYHVEGVNPSAMVQIKPIVDFSRMKMAGYASVIKEIVERVFAPRKFSADLCKQFGPQFIRSVILYGPPGTGKTCLIKSLCEYFNIQPHIINGLQLLNSLIGKPEEAVRLLFEEASKDQKDKGDSSPLHVFVFDEMDALFSRRTSNDGGSDTRNGVVNQLLTMMDGYEQLNNILIFGTTNRLDMIDPALLRGGRFELAIKIDLPNAQDRMEIINFHLKKPRENGRLAADVSMTNLQQLVNATENFSGADLAQVVRIAITEANRRLLKGPIINLDKLSLDDEKNAVLKWNDLLYGFHRLQQLRQDAENNAKAKENNNTE